MSYKFNDFKYWFYNVGLNKFDVKHKASNTIVADISNDSINMRNVDPDFVITDIEAEFEEFKKRPEYLVGQPVQVNGAAFETCHDEYSSLIEGIIKIRADKAGLDPDTHMSYVESILKWVESTDFYQAPASSIYHENFPHGLLYHTLLVYNNMCDLREIPKFENVDIAGASLCALTHDWCKIGLYESYKKNVKNEQTGQWEKVDAYRRGNFPHPFGHGAASMYMVMKSFKITEEEALAIRWHMSRWNVDDNEQNEYQQACEDYPMVHLIQFADQLAITNY